VTWCSRFVDVNNLTGALHVLQLQLSPLTISITLISSNKIQIRDTLESLVPANPGPPVKVTVKTERVSMVLGRPMLKFEEEKILTLVRRHVRWSQHLSTCM